MAKKSKSRKLVLIAIALIGCAWMAREAFRMPPDEVTGAELGELHEIVREFHYIPQHYPEELEPAVRSTTEIERERWRSLVFTIDISAGNTETGLYRLRVGKKRYRVFYFHGHPYLYFQFLPTLRYGWFRGPGPAGWARPHYSIPATPENLELILGGPDADWRVPSRENPE